MSAQALGMRCRRAALSAVVALGLALPLSAAADIVLFDWAFHLDATNYVPGDTLPANVNTAAFDFTTGLGSIGITISGAGGHNIAAFFDHEIDETVNTFFNETGSVVGVPVAGQSWEIDEPGFVFGDIYANVLVGALDNSIGTLLPDDVSMAQGWNFVLAADEIAALGFRTSTTPPVAGFYLRHLDPDSLTSVYFSSSLVIRGEAVPIPEPESLALIGIALAAVAGMRSRKTTA